ncbi:Rieske (2Fe-2S) iron-sulfur domain protein [Gloeocapsa sp. PCC 7428]|uniref:aromatic ring-hydroxylating oxygenase subunit alpha n=1 Tax=Gloeocapsa sp. PCC 7428 TaxID=1173026 RepID=UPI0002A5BDBA|nr:aromatic ring-hydroxylating dioxygenase subunit alpha [Gloeocapsa sp. PCC 7428]AFZ29676.1 Rieske (2Fe-2S) iron-sulfur domain protein [Gloeocapsa sp. PCC 7428]
MAKNDFLRDVWYYALPGGSLKRGAMVAKTLLGEPIVFARSREGKVFALCNICPHRAVPLSCGRFDGQEIECCYHGWRFDQTGRCTEIPALVEGDSLDLKRFQVKQYPVREVQGNIWIYMASNERKAPPATDMEVPVVPFFGDKSYQLVVTLHFPCYVDHAIIGLMDPAHISFVHRSWWWKSGRSLFEEVKAFDPSPYGFTMRRHKIPNVALGYRLIGGGAPETEIAFRLPGVRIEHVSTEHHNVCNLTAVTPLSETETEVTTLLYWTTPWITAIKPLIKPFVRAFLDQDRQVVIKQQEGLKYDPTLLLIRDADTQARWYYQLKAEFTRAAAEGRPFNNPVKTQILRWRS